MKIKRLLIAGLMAVLLIGFAGCSEAEKVDHNQVLPALRSKDAGGEEK